VKKIDLFSHNEEGYKNLVSSLENNNFSFIERATGTGKSYILIKYMAEHFVKKRVLFVTLHDSMFKQLTERDMPALGTSKDIYEKLDCVLYSSIGKHSAEWYYENYDCIIFDEAHHCGAPQWGETIGELRDLIRNAEDKKMIGATATGIRYLDNYMDVAKEFFDDNVASRLSIAEAILNEILPAPFYINNNRVVLENIEKIQKKLSKLENFKELDRIREIVNSYEQEIKRKTKTNTLLKKYDVKNGEKYIVFCESIEELKRKKVEVDSWFKDIAPLEKYEAHSLQQNKENQYQIDLFENNNNPNTIKVMFAVDMFNEGLHIKGVDGIIMTRKTSSPIIYLQQLGRALSFSVRKKQIKIFDLVGNATQIDIIYNLYKELISEAKKELERSKNNEEHFKEIINRFKIVDEGNEAIEQLDTIDKFLDENYLNKEKIKRYILILKNYITNINKDFMTLLHDRKIDKEHLNIYNELRKLSDNLTFEDYIELNKLGIIISDYQQDNEILEKIKLKGNLKNVKESEIKEIIYKYNLFYTNHNRRPTEIDEYEIVSKYREYLSTMNKKEVSKYLKNVEYPLNVEELLILKDYPSVESLDEYNAYIENKYIKGVSLDKLEKRTIESISKLMSLKEKPIISSLLNNNVRKIDESITVLKEYLLNYPNEKFENIDKFSEMPEIKVALNNLHKNAIYVTNLQFEVLLEMGISLPKEIDMTLEERKKELSEYESFFEKEESIKRSIVKQINEFIKKQGRRPNIDNPEEYELAKKYNKFFKERNSTWTQMIAKTMLEVKVPLTIDEKIICGLNINDNDLDLIYESVLNDFNNCHIETYNSNLMRKKIKILKNHSYIDDRLYKVWNRTNNVIEYIFTNNEKNKRDSIKTYLYNNQSLVPFGLIGYIFTDLGMSLLKVNSASRRKDEFINIAHQKYIEEIKKVNEYINYIKENGKRPEEHSILSSGVRDYLSKASTRDIKTYCDRLNELNIPLTLEESYLLKTSTLEIEKELYKKILEKRRRTANMDALDSRIYATLDIQFSYNNKIEEEYSDELISFTNKEMKDDIISEIKEKIKSNPNEEIDFSNIYIPDSLKEELEKYRIICLSKSFITNLIENMNKEKKSYKELLDKNNMHLLELMIRYCKSSNQNIELIDKLIKLDREIILSNNNINIEEFILDYLEYIKKNDKEPNINSENIEEMVLAKKYDILKEILPSEDKKQLFNSIRKNIEHLQKKDFYTTFIEFIESKERFPSILGDTPEEIELAKEYQKIGSKLSAEQRKNINILMKKYQMNTIMFIEKKKGK